VRIYGLLLNFYVRQIKGKTMPAYELGFTAQMDNGKVKVTFESTDGFIVWTKHFDSMVEVKKTFAKQIKKGLFFDATEPTLPRITS
jgi:hypothetical protein